MLGYRIEIAPDDNGTFLVTCPQLPMVATFGNDPGDARLHALDAIETALASMIEDGEAVPVPDRILGEKQEIVRLPLLTALKVNLHWAFQASGVTLDEMAERMRWSRHAVERLFEIGHSSRIEEMEQAFRALGRDLDVEVGIAA